MIEALKALLRLHRCNVDARQTVGECVDAGQCGCSCGLLLAPPSSAPSSKQEGEADINWKSARAYMDAAARYSGVPAEKNAARAFLALDAAAGDAETALDELFGLIQTGVLVRNITDDAKAGWSIQALKLVRTLQATETALSRLQAVRGK